MEIWMSQFLFQLNGILTVIQSPDETMDPCVASCEPHDQKIQMSDGLF